MTSYVSIPNGDIDQDSPVTQPLLTALRDNPIAITEGAANAPYEFSAWRPYNSLVAGDGNTGLIYSFPTNGALATVTSPDFVDGWEYAFWFDRIRASSGSSLTCTCNLYRETSAAYAGGIAFTNASVGSSVPFAAWIEVEKPRRVQNFHAVSHQSTVSLSNNISQSGVNTGRNLTSHTTAQKILRAQFALSANNITGSGSAGQIYMYRRRTAV